MPTRQLTLPELGLLIFMLRGQPSPEALLASLPTAEVTEREDSGMGSLEFVSGKQNRRLGKRIAEQWYTDADGIAVLASLYLDTEGELYELDSWKVDQSPLQRIPAF